MLEWQRIIVSAFAMFSLISFLLCYYKTKYKQNAYGLTLPLNLIGAFVWADGIIFGLFWSLACLVVLYLNDWILFLLIVSVFWLVRSLGETIYWFNEQFATNHRNPVAKLPFQKIFHNDSVWFIFQIFWQCVTVTTLITTLYLAHIWLASK